MKKEKILTVAEIDNTKNEKKLNALKKLMKRETNEAYRLMEIAKKNYENVLRSFVIREITGEKNFDKSRKESIRMALDCHETTPWFDMCSNTQVEIIFLNEMICHYELDLLNPEE